MRSQPILIACGSICIESIFADAAADVGCVDVGSMFAQLMRLDLAIGRQPSVSFSSSAPRSHLVFTLRYQTTFVYACCVL